MYKYCSAPFSEINIEANGDVNLCLCGAWNTKNPIGNIKETSLEELFNGEWVADFRETIYDQSFKYCDRNNCGKIWNLDEIETFDNIKIPRLPTVVYFQELDRTCNLQCPSCRDTLEYHEEINQKTKIVLDRVVEAYQNFDQPVRINGDGSGEFLASATYMDFIQRKDLPRCFNFSLNTNGTLLNKNIKFLAENKERFGTLTVSFDAATPETYKKVRGSDFNLMLTGVKKCIDLGINIVAHFVVQQLNYHEMLDFKKLCDEIGVVYIGFEAMNRWQHMSDNFWEHNRLDNNVNVDSNLLIAQFDEIATTSNNVFLGGTLSSIVDKYKKSGLH